MDGVIILNKPKGMTSHDVVFKCRKLLKEKKIGHTGTLDPDATGVLPILIGKATKASDYLMSNDKTYRVTLKLGILTDTGDSSGEQIGKKHVNVDENEVLIVLKEFIGPQKQIPPMYSAIKVEGKKLYEYAREGQIIKREPRHIEIFGIYNINLSLQDNLIEFDVKCSKGTYIRVLCEDIAQRLNTYGHMNSLVRLKSGEFKIENAVTLEELEQKQNNQIFIESVLISLDKAFKNKEKIMIKEININKFLNGVKIEMNLPDDIYRIYNESEDFIGLASVLNKNLKREIVIEIN